MKLLLLLLAPGCIFASEPKTLHLDYKEKDAASYSTQIQTKFKELLELDASLAKEFKKFESTPPEGGRGRYDGEPTIQALTLSESENVDFRDNGGSKNFKLTIALYYRFDEGMHRGTETYSGFFALFDVTGDLSYRHLDNGAFELTKSLVTAKFKGFSRALTAPKPEDDH